MHEGHWLADRNLLASEAMKAPFYAAADGAFTMADGRAEDRAGQMIGGSEGWGSDISRHRGSLPGRHRGDREQREHRAGGSSRIRSREWPSHAG